VTLLDDLAADDLAVDASTGVADVEVCAPLPTLVGVPPLGLRCLVRVAGRPVGVLDLSGPAERVAAEDLARRVWDELASAITAGLEARGVPEVGTLTASGFQPTGNRVGGSSVVPVTVAIATRDRPETLARCLEGVLAASPAPAAVVVVDNAPSDDRTRRLVAEVHGDDPRVTYVVEPRPGLGRAHNAALPHVATTHVAFTDDDVVVDPGWVGALHEAFSTTPDVACVTGLIAPAELRTPEQWWVERAAGFGKGFERRVRSLRSAGDEGPLFPFDAGTFGSGANMAFSTAHLLEVGGFDAALGTGTGSLGGDDLAALHRAVASGHDLVYEPAAVVFHRHHDTLAALERQARGYGAGLTAYLASVVAERPSAALEIARRALPGIGRVLRPSSDLNARRDADHPRSLVRQERLGMLTGPARYLAQRWRDRRTDRAAA
jgi:GT2 family glycosyltransferase